MDQPAAPSGQIRTRLSVLFAADAPRAVILLRAPRRHWRLITWDLQRDVFTLGQWMAGLIRLCDLSPSGEKLIYWAAQHHRSAPRRTILRPTPRKLYDPLTVLPSKPPRPGRRVPRYMQHLVQAAQTGAPAQLGTTWTAISTPPYFTALALWPAFAHSTGGGLFLTNHEILIHEPEDRMVPIETVPIPRQVRIGCWFTSGQGFNPSAHRPSEGTNIESGQYWEALVRGGASWIEWVHIHKHGDLLFACDGCVYRLSRWQQVDPTDYLRAAKRIADFRGMRFEAVQAPREAMQW